MCPTNKLEWYKAIILSAHVSEIANNAVSFLGVVISLNNKESNNIYFLLMFLTFCIANLVLGNLFCDIYICHRLKFGLWKRQIGPCVAVGNSWWGCWQICRQIMLIPLHMCSAFPTERGGADDCDSI